MLRPRIFGWRLAAGSVLWVGAISLMLVLVWSIIGAASAALPIAGATVGWVAITVGFWRGNAVARWLALVPAGLLGFGALLFWGLSSICSSSLIIALSCAPGPLPPVSMGFWVIRAALIAATGLVVAGILLPGTVARGDAPTPGSTDQGADRLQS